MYYRRYIPSSGHFSHLVLLSGFNVDIKNNCSPAANYLTQLLDTYNCVQLIKQPTRVTENCVCLLDLIIVNNELVNVSSDVLDTCLSEEFI